VTLVVSADLGVNFEIYSYSLLSTVGACVVYIVFAREC
jgi:hypothetical protein